MHDMKSLKLLSLILTLLALVILSLPTRILAEIIGMIRRILFFVELRLLKITASILNLSEYVK